MDPKAADAAAAIAREQRSTALLRQTAQEVQQLRDELEQGELVADLGLEQEREKLRAERKQLKAKLAPVN